MSRVSLKKTMKHFLRIQRISKTPRANEQFKKSSPWDTMFLGIRFVQKLKSLFSVDKPVSETAQEPSQSSEDSCLWKKNNTLRENWDQV